jgi:hypothetical protein
VNGTQRTSRNRLVKQISEKVAGCPAKAQADQRTKARA